jgi:alpha-L-arabinofuranosidase
MNRRNAIKTALVGATGITSMAGGFATAKTQSAGAINIDAAPRFEISPHLYMQFMEPLGTTDSSVEAARLLAR